MTIPPPIRARPTPSRRCAGSSPRAVDPTRRTAPPTTCAAAIHSAPRTRPMPRVTLGRRGAGRCAGRRLADPRPRPRRGGDAARVARLSPRVAADLRDRVAVGVRVAMVGRLPGQHIRTMRHTPCRLIMRSATLAPIRIDGCRRGTGDRLRHSAQITRRSPPDVPGGSGLHDDGDDHRPATVARADPVADRAADRLLELVGVGATDRGGPSPAPRRSGAAPRRRRCRPRRNHGRGSRALRSRCP